MAFKLSIPKSLRPPPKSERYQHQLKKSVDALENRIYAAKISNNAKDAADPQRIPDAVITTLEQQLAEAKAEPSAPAVCRLQVGLAHALTDDALRTLLVEMRKQYSELTSRDEWETYGSIKRPDPQGGDLAKLRDQCSDLAPKLAEILDGLHVVERKRLNLILFLIASILVMIVIGLGVLLRFDSSSQPGAEVEAATQPATQPAPQPFGSLIGLAAYCGALGGLFSLLLRFQNVSIRRLGYLYRGTSGVSVRQLRIDPILAAVQGMVGAVVFITLIASGVIQGALFPEFAEENTTGKGLTSVLFLQPSSSVQVLKAIVWSFIAGFAERIVPDSLNRLSRGASPAPPAQPT